LKSLLAFATLLGGYHKYRRKVFEEPYREALKKIIKKIGYDYTIEIVDLEIP
jgi:putative transposase